MGHMILVCQELRENYSECLAVLPFVPYSSKTRFCYIKSTSRVGVSEGAGFQKEDFCTNIIYAGTNIFQ